MTEAMIKKLDGCRVRFYKLEFNHSIKSHKYQGIIHVIEDKNNYYRDNKLISKEHISFYLYEALVDNIPQRKAPFIEWKEIRLIRELVVMEDATVEN